jgi:hypothetical protein
MEKIETLESIFRKPGIRQYEVQFNRYPPILLIIGNGKVFTTGITRGNPYDSDNACIELFERDGALFINSYYDEPGTICTVIDHTLMFRVLKLLAKHMGFTTIELLDGSRKRIDTGCEWDLRILNRLYKGDETKTFYEKHGFVALVDPLSRDKPPIRLASIFRLLSEVNQTYIDDKNIRTIKELVTHMYELCNSKEFSTATINDEPLSDFFNALSRDIKRSIAAARGRSEEDEVIKKENMTYYFHIDPSINSTCVLERPVLAILDGVHPTHGTGSIRFILEPETLLDKSHTTGGRRRHRRTRRRRTRKVTRF